MICHAILENLGPEMLLGHDRPQTPHGRVPDPVRAERLRSSSPYALQLQIDF